MKNNKKKVIAAALAISMTVSPLQGVAFTEDLSHAAILKSQYEEKFNTNCKSDSRWWDILGWFKPGNDGACKYYAAVSSILGNLVDREVANFKVGEDVVNKALNSYAMSDASTGNGSVLGSIWSMIKSSPLNIFNNPILSMLLAVGAISYVKSLWNNFMAKIEAGKIEKPINPAEAMQKLDILMQNLKGQPKAKEQIRRAVLNIVDKHSQFKLQRNSKKAGPGANVIYMVGPSGVGKSFSADMIRQVLNGFNAEPYVIEASDIDRNSKVSAVEQLFGMKVRRVNMSEVYEYSPIITRLKAVPDTVFIINEYDKMYTEGLDEKLRTIMDQGYINVNGEKIDCSAATFIITSNESHGSVTKGNTETDDNDDGTGSRTFIDHDKAFLNRIKLIEFDNLTAEEYREIAMWPFIHLASRYSVQYGINLDLNGTIDAVAKRVEQLNKGARPIFTYLEALNDKLLNDVVLQNLNKADGKVNYKVSFKDDSFELERLDGKCRAATENLQ